MMQEYQVNHSRLKTKIKLPFVRILSLVLYKKILRRVGEMALNSAPFS